MWSISILELCDEVWDQIKRNVIIIFFSLKPEVSKTYEL